MAKPKQLTRSSFSLFPVVVGLVVVLGVVAVIASRGGSEKKKTTVAGLEETRQVTVAGAALADYTKGKSPDPAAGQSIPEVRGAAFDGTPVKITNDGKGKVIVFVAHWCPHCQR